MTSSPKRYRVRVEPGMRLLAGVVDRPDRPLHRSSQEHSLGTAAVSPLHQPGDPKARRLNLDWRRAWARLPYHPFVGMLALVHLLRRTKPGQAAGSCENHQEEARSLACQDDPGRWGLGISAVRSWLRGCG